MKQERVLGKAPVGLKTVKKREGEKQQQEKGKDDPVGFAGEKRNLFNRSHLRPSG